VAGVATKFWSNAMMGLTDRVEPWARRFQRASRPEAAREAENEPVGASVRASGDDGAGPPALRTGRFTRERVLQEQPR
jgi:hypothetical protein